MTRQSMSTGLRTHLCGTLRLEHVEPICPSWRMGSPQPKPWWPRVCRPSRSDGLVQVSFDPRTAGADAMSVAESLASESVVLVEGSGRRSP